MGFTGSMQGMKGKIASALNVDLGMNRGQLGAAWKQGKLGGVGQYAKSFFGFGPGATSTLSGAGFSRAGLAAKAARAALPAGTTTDVLATAGKKAFWRSGFGMRGAVGIGAIGAASMGVSAITGYSMFDQAQAVIGAGLGARFAGRRGLGRAGTIGSMAAGGFGMQYMNARDLMYTSAGYWGARGLQRLGGKTAGSKAGMALFGRFSGGGGAGRLLGGLAGYGIAQVL